MSQADRHIPVFEKTIATTHRWLRELKDIGGLADENEAYSVLRAVLHALRDRLPTDEAAQLASEMPMLIRGFYYEGWKPSVTPRKQRSLAAFLEGVHVTWNPEKTSKQEYVSYVFKMLTHRISDGEIADVHHAMPSEVRELWPA